LVNLPNQNCRPTTSVILRSVRPAFMDQLDLRDHFEGVYVAETEEAPDSRI
jgi:hypothetical protein